MKHTIKITGAACLAVGLVSTWDTAHAQLLPAFYPNAVWTPSVSFTGQITPTENLYDVYFLFAGMECTPAYAALIANEIPANTTLSFNVTFNSIWAPYAGASPNVGNNFAIAAVYNPTSGGVTLGMDPTQAANIIAQNRSFNGTPASSLGNWTEDFYTTPPYTYIDGGSANESTVASTLENGTYDGYSLNDSDLGGIMIDPNSSGSYVQGHTGYAVNYYPTISTDPNNPSDFSLVNFSGASAGGSGYAVEVVPEPTTISFLALSLLSCGWLRHRNS